MLQLIIPAVGVAIAGVSLMLTLKRDKIPPAVVQAAVAPPQLPPPAQRVPASTPLASFPLGTSPEVASAALALANSIARASTGDPVADDIIKSVL